MPPKSKEQERFMAAVANNPKFANKVGVPEKELDIGSSREMRPGENPRRAFARRIDEAGGFDQMSPQGKRELLFDMQEGFRDKKGSDRQKRYQGRPARNPKGMMGGGKVKKGYKHGGKVRGCGMAKQGVRRAKMVKMKGA